jgi:hypothetical protein
MIQEREEFMLNHKSPTALGEFSNDRLQEISNKILNSKKNLAQFRNSSEKLQELSNKKIYRIEERGEYSEQSDFEDRGSLLYKNESNFVGNTNYSLKNLKSSLQRSKPEANYDSTEQNYFTKMKEFSNNIDMPRGTPGSELSEGKRGFSLGGGMRETYGTQGSTGGFSNGDEAFSARETEVERIIQEKFGRKADLGIIKPFEMDYTERMDSETKKNLDKHCNKYRHSSESESQTK